MMTNREIEFLVSIAIIDFVLFVLIGLVIKMEYRIAYLLGGFVVVILSVILWLIK